MQEHKDQLNSQERLSLLVEISQSFNSSLDLDEILARVMDRVISSMGAERGFVVLPDTNSNLVYRAARGIENQSIDKPESQISGGAIEEVLSTGKALLSTNAQTDDRLKDNPSVISLKLRSILCVPLKAQALTLGAIYIDNRFSSGLFTDEDQEFLMAIAASATNAIEHARLFHESIEKGQMERDLEVAHQVQEGLIPRKMPQVPGWELAGKWVPAKEVAGDFYHVIELDEGKLCFLIGDVSGKGAAAAIFMAVAKNIIDSRISSDSSVSSILTYANAELAKNNLSSMFVSVFIGIIDTNNGKLSFSNGGHNPPLIIKEDSQILKLDEYHGPVLGALSDSKYKESSLILEAGDLLLLFTDGVTEAVSEQEDYYGERRLKSLLQENSTSPPSLLAEGVIKEINAFRGKAEQADDITILVLKATKDSKKRTKKFLNMKINTSESQIEEAIARVNKFCRDEGISDPLRRKVGIAMDELLGNIKKYAFDENELSKISISIGIEKDVIKINISDDGKSFNPFDLESPKITGSIEKTRPGGLGIFLTRELVDEFAYQREEGKNIVDLVMARNSA